MTATLSRVFLVQWLNQLGIAINRIEDIGKGSAICALLKLLDDFFPKFREDPQNELDYMYNLKIVQAYMDKKGIKLFFPIERMCKCKMQDNLEVAQWFYKYWEKETNLPSEIQSANDQNYTQKPTESNQNYTYKSTESNDHNRSNYNYRPTESNNFYDQRLGESNDHNRSNQNYNQKPTETNNFYDQITESNDQIFQTKNYDYLSEIDVVLGETKKNEDSEPNKSINNGFIDNIKRNPFENRNIEEEYYENQPTDSFIKNSSAIPFSPTNTNQIEKETTLHLEMINDLQEQLKFKDEKISKLKEVAKVFENERDYYFDKLVMIERVFKEENLNETLKNKVFSIMYEDEYY